MDEAAAAQLALDVAATLKNISKDVAQVRETGFKALEILSRQQADEVPQPSDEEAANLAPVAPLTDESPDAWQTVVTSSLEVPSEFFSDLMSFQYMQTVLFVFMLLALLLNLGATLWLAFSDKWRS